MDKYKDNIVRINSIDTVIDVYFELVHNNYNVILVSDIDDTILSSKMGQKFVENNIKLLIDYVYSNNPDNLIFLTARDHTYKGKTNHHLNSASMHKKDKYIYYNIICSPYDYTGAPTKGVALINYFEKGKGKELLNSYNNIWILFIDDSIEQVLSVHNSIDQLKNIRYTIFHYNHF